MFSLNYMYLHQGSYVFGRVGLFVGLSIRPSTYLESDERICMDFLPETCGSRAKEHAIRLWGWSGSRIPRIFMKRVSGQGLLKNKQKYTLYPVDLNYIFTSILHPGPILPKWLNQIVGMRWVKMTISTDWVNRIETILYGPI